MPSTAHVMSRLGVPGYIHSNLRIKLTIYTSLSFSILASPIPPSHSATRQTNLSALTSFRLSRSKAF
jgi:hypothetical protein